MDYEIGREGMISAQDEAMKRVYRRVDDSQGNIWLYAVQENPGDNVYVWLARESPREGFSGAELTFQLEDGTALVLRGPWHTSAESLFEATGVDLRATYLTFGVIGRGRRHEGWRDWITGVLYQDEQPTVGEFDRITKLARRMADELGETLYYYQRSQGGSSNGPVYPKGKHPLRDQPAGKR